MKTPLVCFRTTAILLCLYFLSGIQALILNMTYASKTKKGSSATFNEGEVHCVLSGSISPSDGKTRYVIEGTVFAEKFGYNDYEDMLDMIKDEKNWKAFSIERLVGKRDLKDLKLLSKYYTAYSKTLAPFGFIKDKTSYDIFDNGNDPCLVIEAGKPEYKN